MKKTDYKPIPMTITVNKGKGRSIPLYYVAGDTFVRLDDVTQLVSDMKYKYKEGKEKGYISDKEECRIHAFLALNHLQTQLYKSETDQAETVDDHKKVILKRTKERKKSAVPPRYAVGKQIGEDEWVFYRYNPHEGCAEYTARPCKATLYENYREAEACADFTNLGKENGWVVIDWWDNMTADEQTLRQLLCDNDADDGNEKAIPVTVIGKTDD